MPVKNIVPMAGSGIQIVNTGGGAGTRIQQAGAKGI